MINALIYDAPVKKMTLKTLHVLPALVLYQPSKNSKSKGHKRLFERRFDIWKKLDNKKKKMSMEILLLTDKTLQLLKVKHPDEKEGSEEAILHGLIQKITLFCTVTLVKN